MRTLLPSRIFRANNGSAIASAARAAATDCSNPPACLRNCRCFARVQDLDQLNCEVWFSSSAPRGSPNPSGGGSDNKPPDERTLQLGKSRFGHFLTGLHLILINYSHQDTPREPSNASTKAAPIGDALPSHQPSPLPFDPSTPPDSLRQDSVCRRTMDSTGSLGPHASSRQREAHNLVRTHGAPRRQQRITREQGREAHREVEDMRQDRTPRWNRRHIPRRRDPSEGSDGQDQELHLRYARWRRS
jgi:hypothetical protein